MEWYLKVVRDNYANFSGRARRKEYWMFTLFNLIIILPLYVLTLVGVFAESGALMAVCGGLLFLYALAIFVPSMAVAVRRLHDTNKSGWFILIGFIPFASIILLVFMVLEGDRGNNPYGPDPKANEYLQ